jgi:hypothetical protein
VTAWINLDAITHTRPYRGARPFAEAIADVPLSPHAAA